MNRLMMTTVALTFALAGNAANLYMAGDSTLHSRKVTKPGAGIEETCLGSWGDELENYVKPGVKIVNLAMSGRSTKSFIDEGRWDKLIKQVQSGDYVFIQFGHNDQKKNKPKVYAAADGAYRENLTRFAKEVRAKGGKPVFGTSMVRRTFDKQGKIRDGLGAYPETVRKLGKELGVPVVDMNAFTRKKVEATPQEESIKWYRASVNKTDFTHPTKEGAKVFAKLFVDDVKQNKLELAELFKE